MNFTKVPEKLPMKCDSPSLDEISRELKYPVSLDSLKAGSGEYALVIEKEKQAMEIYKRADFGWAFEKNYRVSTGKNPGNKTRQGDLKTPESPEWKSFRVMSIEKSSDWLFEGERAYGPYAARLNAGSWDKHGNHNKDGYSPILIHGTNEPEKIGARASHGCVRLRNEDILEAIARGYLRAGTKVIIKERMERGVNKDYFNLMCAKHEIKPRIKTDSAYEAMRKYNGSQK